MTDETPAESSRRSSGMGWILWACFIVFIVYPLSTGPVIAIADAIVPIFSSGRSSSLLWESIETFYAPLVFLTDTFEPLEDFLIWYLELWGI